MRTGLYPPLLILLLTLYKYRALLVNIRPYNTAHTAGDIAQMKALKSSFEAALPLLDRVGLFDLFTPDKWVQGENKGCKVVR